MKNKQCKHMWLPRSGYTQWLDPDPAHGYTEGSFWIWETIYCAKCKEVREIK